MAIAGKVAITPGGEWSVDVAYDKLVIVTFGNNVYLSIKPSTGIEPTNEEYWMLLIENVTQEQYDEIINGTTAVGNALQLGGKGASEWQSEITQLNGTGEWLSTSILEKALEVGVGVHSYTLGGSYYTGTDLPDSAWAFGVATIYKRGASSLSVVLHSESSNKSIINSYNGVKWTGWGISTTTADLANYLSLSGGEVNGNITLSASDATGRYERIVNSLRDIGIGITGSGAFYIQDKATSNNIILSTADGTNTFNGTATGNLPLTGGTLKGDLTIQKHSNGYTKVFKNHSETADYGSLFMDVAEDGKRASVTVIANLNKAIFEGNDGTAKEFLHTGNSAKVAIQESAPSDTTALWYDTVNKMCKRYVDGAWQA